MFTYNIVCWRYFKLLFKLRAKIIPINCFATIHRVIFRGNSEWLTNHSQHCSFLRCISTGDRSNTFPKSKRSVLKCAEFRKCAKSTLFPSYWQGHRCKGNHKGSLRKSQYRRLFCCFSTITPAVFGAFGKMVGTGN